MPLPSRREDESRENFMSRCMSDNKVSKEFPDGKQRTAVCMSKALEGLSTSASVDMQYNIETFGYTEDINEDNFYVPAEADYVDFQESTEEWDISVAKPGLWENIRKKKQREGDDYRPAKTEKEGRPSPEELKKAQGPKKQKKLGPPSYAEEANADKPPKGDPRRTPAPKKDQKRGSKKNKPDSAKNPSGKITSHAPKMSRDGWAMARVNAFLTLLRTGKPSNSAYTQDNDLLPKGHPKKSKAAYVYENPKTGERFSYNRKGNYKKDGTPLLYKGKSAEYQGRKVTLNKPFRTPDGPKKFAVYTKNGSGKVVIVRFGDPNMEIKRDNPERRKSFRARHKCDTAPGPKWKARYWSCRMW